MGQWGAHVVKLTTGEKNQKIFHDQTLYYYQVKMTISKQSLKFLQQLEK
jgi:hypothetical protein